MPVPVPMRDHAAFTMHYCFIGECGDDRLLFIGLRRVDSAGQHDRDAVREGVTAQQRLGARVRGGGRRQVRAGGRLPWRRLLRRHPRYRRGDLRRAGTYPRLPRYNLASWHTILPL